MKHSIKTKNAVIYRNKEIPKHYAGICENLVKKVEKIMEED